MMMWNAFKLPRVWGDYDPNEASDDSGLLCEDESRAVQSDAEQADINVLVRRYGLGAVMPEDMDVPSFASYDDVFDFQTAQNAIAEANQSFQRMPPDVRLRFANDPQVFLEFATDPANVEEMVKLGLAVKKPDPVPERVMKVEVITPPPSAVPPKP